MQTRIDLWKPELLELLGAAGCVSIEAGIESLTVEGREALAKRCRLETEDLAQLLFKARRHVPFVQANLIGMEQDNEALVAYWRDRLIAGGVWANEPVPLYPYPSSPGYRALWGEPDDRGMGARARRITSLHSPTFSDMQDERPVPLAELEATCCERDRRGASDDDRCGGRRLALRYGPGARNWSGRASNACWSAAGRQPAEAQRRECAGCAM